MPQVRLVALFLTLTTLSGCLAVQPPPEAGAFGAVLSDSAQDAAETLFPPQPFGGAIRSKHVEDYDGTAGTGLQTVDLADGAVTGPKLAGDVPVSKLRPGSPGTALVTDGAAAWWAKVGAAHVDSDSIQRRVTTACAPGWFLVAIHSDGTATCAPASAPGGDDGLANVSDSVGTHNLQDGSVTPAKLSGGIPFALLDVADAAIAPSKLASGSVSQVLLGGAVPTWGQVDARHVNETSIQRRVSTVCPAGSFITAIGADGAATCVAAEGNGGGVPAGGWGVAQGGTGITGYAAGDLLYASAPGALSRLGAAGAGSVLLSGAAPSWGKVELASHVAGVLPAANGGTGADDVQLTKSGSSVRTFTLPDVSDTLAVLNTAQTWGAAQYFFQGVSLNALSRTGNYSMSNTESVIFMSPDAATQWVELPCATTVGAGRIAVVKKMNTLYSIYVAGCPPGTEKIDNASTITMPSAYRGSLILMSRGTSNGWVVIGSHGIAED